VVAVDPLIGIIKDEKLFDGCTERRKAMALISHRRSRVRKISSTAIRREDWQSSWDRRKNTLISLEIFSADTRNDQPSVNADGQFDYVASFVTEQWRDQIVRSQAPN
jgi:hypothetical protein